MILGFGIKGDFNELSTLESVHKAFEEFLDENNISYDTAKSLNFSDFLINISPYLDDFLSHLFSIEKEILDLRQKAQEFNEIYECKRTFVQREALKKYPLNSISEEEFNKAQIFLVEVLGEDFSHEIFAKEVLASLRATARERGNPKWNAFIDAASKYASYRVSLDQYDVLFSIPYKIDPYSLLNKHLINKCASEVRYGFENRTNLKIDKALSEAKYCIYCHKQNKDSCSKGLKSIEPKKGGCPLRQKISEMNYVAAQGFYLASLAIIIVDNPMVAATGRRICNDCSASCIFQKQEPVDVPYVESNILQTVLDLPYGFEIYYLLTKWNPLNLKSTLPLPKTNYNILVAGLGPAGFAISHYLLHSGHNVVAIDASKITPLNYDFNKPIKFWKDYKQNLKDRLPKGFGGVAEYGITPRWDKNNLDIIRIILERNKNFKIFDSVKLGGNITKAQAFDEGFDHIAICTGAGAPKFFGAGMLFKGVKTAAEVLMSLQSGGAFLDKSNVNLLIRLPVIIIGCGLTAIDAAVEILNYYPVQIKKFMHRLTSLKDKPLWTEEEQIIANEFIAHAKLFEGKSDKEIREIIIEKLEGVSICYHKTINQSTAFKLNHEEIAHALAAGIKFIEDAKLLKINSDNFDSACSVEFEKFSVKAHTVLSAIGVENSKIENEGKITYFGDCDPLYAGSVVKALASAKDGYESINLKLSQKAPSFKGNYNDFLKKLDYLLVSKIKKITNLNDKIIEIVVTSPFAAKNFIPGQFFKLQNYNNDPQKLIKPLSLTGLKSEKEGDELTFIIEKIGRSTSLCQNFKPGELISLVGPNGTESLNGPPKRHCERPFGSAAIQKRVVKPLLSSKFLDCRGSNEPRNDCLAVIQQDLSISATMQPIDLFNKPTLLLIGSGIKNIFLSSLINDLRNKNSSIIHLAHYLNEEEMIYLDKIQDNYDHFIRCFDINEGIKQVKNYNISNIICSTSTENSMLIRQNFPNANISFMTNAPMQCMMQGICGQCIASNDKAPKGYIFSCNYYILDSYVLLPEINGRLKQNSLLEKLNNIYPAAY